LPLPLIAVACYLIGAVWLENILQIYFSAYQEYLFL